MSGYIYAGSDDIWKQDDDRDEQRRSGLILRESRFVCRRSKRAAGIAFAQTANSPLQVFPNVRTRNRDGFTEIDGTYYGIAENAQPYIERSTEEGTIGFTNIRITAIKASDDNRVTYSLLGGLALLTRQTQVWRVQYCIPAGAAFIGVELLENETNIAGASTRISQSEFIISGGPFSSFEGSGQLSELNRVYLTRRDSTSYGSVIEVTDTYKYGIDRNG